MAAFNVKNTRTSVNLLYYREEIEEGSSYHYFVFKIKNTYASKFDFVGIVSTIPPHERERGSNQHYVLRYSNSKELEDVIMLLGIFNLNQNADIRCLHSKLSWVKYLKKHPYTMGAIGHGDRSDYQDREITVEQKLAFSPFLMVLQSVLDSFGLKLGVDDLKKNREILEMFESHFQNNKMMLVGSKA